MTKRVLFVATVLKKHIDHFHIPYIDFFTDKGYEVDVAAFNDYGKERLKYADHYNYKEVSFSRNPFSLSNIKAYKTMKKIINSGQYEIIHCHTPVASVVTRLAARKARKNGTRVIYTAHGFQFVKNGPKKDWFFLLVEMVAGIFTDDLITINEEDYERAKKWIPAKNVHLVNGVGVSLDKFEYRPKNYSPNSTFIISFVAELTPNKNHKLLIDLASFLKSQNMCFEMWFIGEGDYRNELQNYSQEQEVENNIKFLGYRRDVPKLLQKTDIVISTSLREGLPVNILEAYASGVPVIATDARGVRDLVLKVDPKLLSKRSVEDLYSKINYIFKDKDRLDYVRVRQKEIMKEYSLEKVLKEYSNIYFKEDIN